MRGWNARHAMAAGAAVCALALSAACVWVVSAAAGDDGTKAAPAPTYVVNAGHAEAADGNPGTAEMPWKTIGKAAQTAKAGDVVHVLEGTYDERVSPAQAGTKDKPITFLAVGKATVKGFSLAQPYLRVEGFHVTDPAVKGRRGPAGFDVSGDGCQVIGNRIERPAGGAVSLHGCKGAVVRKNVVTYADGVAISISGESHLVEGNDVSHSIKVNAGDADATRFFGSGHVIRGNYLHDITHDEAPGAHVDAFQTYDNQESCRNILIENNYCYNMAAQMLMAEGTKRKESSDVTLRNNVFEKVGAIAINIHGIRNMHVMNNVFVGGKWVAIRLYDGCTGSKVYNNIAVDIDCVWVDEASREGTVCDYNFTAVSPTVKNIAGPHDIKGRDPKFANAAKHDFHLTAGSPAVDAGLDLSKLFKFDGDMTGIKRPQGKAWDMGPHEFGPAGD